MKGARAFDEQHGGLDLPLKLGEGELG
jgi:hypothetical protein